MKRTLHALGIGLLALLVLAAATLTYAYREARRDPVVRRATIALPHWPAGAAPIRVALLSDIHIGNGAMDAARLARIVAQVDAQAPDLVLLAGDFVYGHDPVAGVGYARRLAAPLAALHAPLGVVAVLGNHDHDGAQDTVVAVLQGAGVTVLTNDAAERGPLAVIGIDDASTYHARVDRALAAAARLPGAPLVVTHAPALVRALPPGAAPVMLAGHTHCGQIVMPLGDMTVVRSPLTGQELFDPRYRCGIIHDPTRLVIVTAGLGTSDVPFRIGAPPDWWLLTLGPVSRPLP